MTGKPMKAKKAAPSAGSKPKFGSPAWNAKYGIKPFAKGQVGKKK